MPLSRRLFDNLPLYARVFDEFQNGILQHICDAAIQPELDQVYRKIQQKEFFYDPNHPISALHRIWLQQFIGAAAIQNSYLGLGINPAWSPTKQTDFINRYWNYLKIKTSEAGVKEAIALWLDWDSTNDLTIIYPFGTTATAYPPMWWDFITPYDAHLYQTYPEKQFLGSGDWSQDYQPDWIELTSQNKWDYHEIWSDLLLDAAIAPIINNSWSALGPRNIWEHFICSTNNWNKIAPAIDTLNIEILNALTKPTVFLWFNNIENQYNFTLIKDSNNPVVKNTVITTITIDGFQWGDIYPWNPIIPEHTEIISTTSISEFYIYPGMQFGDLWGLVEFSLLQEVEIIEISEGFWPGIQFELDWFGINDLINHDVEIQTFTGLDYFIVSWGIATNNVKTFNRLVTISIQNENGFSNPTYFYIQTTTYIDFEPIDNILFDDYKPNLTDIYGSGGWWYWDIDITIINLSSVSILFSPYESNVNVLTRSQIQKVDNPGLPFIEWFVPVTEITQINNNIITIPSHIECNQGLTIPIQTGEEIVTQIISGDNSTLTGIPPYDITEIINPLDDQDIIGWTWNDIWESLREPTLDTKFTINNQFTLDTFTIENSFTLETFIFNEIEFVYNVFDPIINIKECWNHFGQSFPSTYINEHIDGILSPPFLTFDLLSLYDQGAWWYYCGRNSVTLTTIVPNYTNIALCNVPDFYTERNILTMDSVIIPDPGLPLATVYSNFGSLIDSNNWRIGIETAESLILAKPCTVFWQDPQGERSQTFTLAKFNTLILESAISLARNTTIKSFSLLQLGKLLSYSGTDIPLKATTKEKVGARLSLAVKD